MDKNEKLRKFEEIAEKRVNESLRRLRLIGNLANRSNYEYTDAHINQIMRALESELRSLKARFSSIDSDSKAFKFKNIRAEGEKVNG